MSVSKPIQQFTDDQRAVSAVIGFILIFAILMLALTIYQAQIVPQQNAQTEFEHSQQVEDEMVEFRNALIEARLDDRTRTPSVKLGTTYQSRTLTVNPPPVTGTLQSIEQNETEIENGDIPNLSNQYFEYTPSYSEYDNAGTIRYENSIVYHEYANGKVMLSEQYLINGSKIRLIDTEPSIDEDGIERVTYEPEPSGASIETVEDPTITIASELDAEVWNKTLKEEGEANNVTITNSNGDVEFSFQGNKDIVYTNENAESIRSGGSQDPSGDPVRGPDITDAGLPEDDEITVEEGDDFRIRATASSVGDPDEIIRSGTPISEINWESNRDEEGNIIDLDPDSSDRTETDDDEFDTEGWEIGEHEIEIYATDASGRISRGEDSAFVSITVEEEEEGEEGEGQLISVDGSGDSDGQELQFDIRNDGDGEITEITEITIEQEDDIGDPIESDGQNDPQVEIDAHDGSDQDGELSVGSSESNQITYDETYDFEEDSQGGAGSYASLSPSNEGTVIIGDFNTDDSDGWDRVEVINQQGEEEDDLLIITLAYQDEGGNIEESELYLDIEED